MALKYSNDFWAFTTDRIQIYDKSFLLTIYITKSNSIIGDKTQIYTFETKITQKSREIQRNQAKTNWKTNKMQISF